MRRLFVLALVAVGAVACCPAPAQPVNVDHVECMALVCTDGPAPTIIIPEEGAS